MTAVHPVPPDSIDRISPTLRPEGRRVMVQRWAELLFLHWIVPAEQITPLLPPGLTLDTFEGNAYIGLVPFTMTGVRPLWMPPFPPITDFHETNVRTYVHYQGRDPGVWFFSLDAANTLAVRVARAAWKLPYHFARMSLKKSPKASAADDSVTASDAVTIEYATERLWPGPLPAVCEARYSVHSPVTPAQKGTLEFFLAERYYLYAYAKERMFRGQVHHVPYPLQVAKVHDLKENLIAAAGITRPEEAPLAHYAREVNVDIYPLKPVTT